MTKSKKKINKSKKKYNFVKKTRKISIFEKNKQNVFIYWNHKMSRSHVGCNFLDYIKNLTFLCKYAPVTGRTMEGYMKHLFLDLKIKSKKNFLNYFKNKNYLDMGSGINHLYSKSLLFHLLKKKYKALGMDLYKFPTPQKNFKSGTVFKTNLKKNNFDIITSQYFLYYWLDDPKKLLKAFKELNRILKKGGTLRIYPVYFGNYHYNNNNLINYLEDNFNILVKKPNFFKEKVAYIYPGENIKEIKFTNLSVPKKEKEDAENLNACTLILFKK